MRKKEREVSEINEIESIIYKCDVCRIAFADDNVPYIVTMNFGYLGGQEKKLYFHCASQGRKLEMAEKNNYVCFQMDNGHELYGGDKGCDWGMKYKSIVGYGHISRLTDRDEKVRALNLIMEHYSGRNDFVYDEKVLDATTVLELAVKEITGKKK
jgi:uncharacterized protein